MHAHHVVDGLACLLLDILCALWGTVAGCCDVLLCVVYSASKANPRGSVMPAGALQADPSWQQAAALSSGFSTAKAKVRTMISQAHTS